MIKKRDKYVKIAIPTNDGVTIFPKMLGMAKTIYIYKIINNSFIFVEERNNVYEKTMQHLKTLDVYELIKDCEIIISSKIGKKGIERLEDKGLKLFFRKGEIRKALLEIIEDKTQNIQTFQE